MPTTSEHPMTDFAYVPDDPGLASALATAERMATAADARMQELSEGEETSAYYLHTAVAHIRAALARAARVPPRGLPAVWWCASCGATRGCRVEHGEIVCPAHHIVATFEANVRVPPHPGAAR